MAEFGSDIKYEIHAACREGQTSKVEALLNTNPKLATLRDPDSRLPIHWATSFSRQDILLLLSERRHFDADAQDGAGWTALMIASSLPNDGGDALVALLLSKGADATLTTTAGATALHFAASKANLDVARRLVAAGGSARAKDRRSQVPLHRAAAVGGVPLIKLLLASRSPVSGADVDGLTPLHHAIAEGHGAAAMELLRAGAEAGKKDSTGALAIDLAPDAKVREYIVKAAEDEGIELQ